MYDNNTKEGKGENKACYCCTWTGITLFEGRLRWVKVIIRKLRRLIILDGWQCRRLRHFLGQWWWQPGGKCLVQRKQYCWNQCTTRHWARVTEECTAHYRMLRSVSSQAENVRAGRQLENKFYLAFHIVEEALKWDLAFSRSNSRLVA